MNTRRDFFKQAALLAASGSLAGMFPEAIQRAVGIEPAAGSTFLDAEHIVVLMQENRSFDHTFGTLRGIRGFNDPRAMTLPNGNPVWLQQDGWGDTYAPFHFDIRSTKATWMGSLPHGWVDQAGARNLGRHDGWLPNKACSTPEYERMPLTLGYYTREDLPFYYALADAFTICDQNFCSSLTATEPNRLHLWTGTVRPARSAASKAYVNNEDMGYDLPLDWTTFPDRLEQHGVSWRIYQNEISLPTGLDDEADAWLSNFDDNPLEYFVQYNVRFSQAHRRYLLATERVLQEQLAAAHAEPRHDEKKVAALRNQLKDIQDDLEQFSPDAFFRLPPHQQHLHRNAFTINDGDPGYRELTTLKYRDGETPRQMQIPKGDVLFQFRSDARAGKLPAISWLVPPERFSDHPSSAWYGAWYIAEVMNILTENPELWKKMIFILAYDENDGYYDHVPPFVPPQQGRPETGKASEGIDMAIEFVSAAQEAETRKTIPDWRGVPGPIGLGFRVPLLIASPWSRGGYVCSEVFDHTSILQFMEVFLTHKTGRSIEESNISLWRRTVCGDLTSAFRAQRDETLSLPRMDRSAFFESIHEAQFKPLPGDMRKLDAAEIAQVCAHPASSPLLPRQERGVRTACALPYDLAADGVLSEDRRSFTLTFSANLARGQQKLRGAPFRLYTPGPVRAAENGHGDAQSFVRGRAWDYAVIAGESLSDSIELAAFPDGQYHLQVSGPNGFYREFKGSAEDPRLSIQLRPWRPGQLPSVGPSSLGDSVLSLVNRDPHRALSITVDNLSYGHGRHAFHVAPAGEARSTLELPIASSCSFGWHDVQIRVNDYPQYAQRFAGHIETGMESMSDPQMAG